MRFRTLALDAYGPFTATVLDLSRAQGNGLHLIYGPNEAGKSSALRAIRDLLFGIPQQTPDAHLHPGPALRLSAHIERGAEELVFARRKKRKDSLCTLEDQPLEEARLASFLNGLDAAAFDRLFGLNQERLQQGGDEMLAGRGDVGEALFDAGASGRSVHRVKLSLVEECEALFKDRAQKPELNRLLALYAEQRKRAKDAQHSPEKYEQQQERVRETRREVEARRAELARLRSEKEHAVRLRNVLSSVAERDRKAAERAALGSLPSLRRDASQRREQLQASIAETERDALRLSRQLAEQRAKLAQLPEPSPLLAVDADAVRAIDRRIGRAEKDLLDLPKRQAESSALRESIAGDLRRLGLGADLEQALSHSLPVSEQARVQALGREHQGLYLKLEGAEREQAAARAQVDVLQAELARVRAARRLQQALLPPAEVPERFEHELAQAREAHAAAVRRHQEVRAERALLGQKLELLHAEHGVPSEAQLAEARRERDALLREAQELAADPKRKALDLCLPLVALGQTSGRADALSDRLRREAERVAQAETLAQRLRTCERELQDLESAERAAQEALSEVQSRWRELTGRLTPHELTPRELSRWLEEERQGYRDVERAEQALLRAASSARETEARVAQAQAALARWREQWQTAVAPLGLGPDARPEEALALMGALNELAVQRQKLSEMERRVDGIRRDIEQFAAQVEAQTAVHLPELARSSPPEAAARLVDLHRRACEVAREREAIEQTVSRLARELSEAEAHGKAAEQQLLELCREVGAADASELFELEQRALRARALDAELLQLDARLAEVCEGEDVGALVQEARRCEKGAVAARLLELDDLISLREEDARELERELTRLELGLSAYAGLDGAEAAQELSATVARLAELSGAWIRRRLASLALERVVEGYRERHQGPVLKCASEIFARLTLGRFSRLQVGLEEARLECVEAEGGKGLELDELSRGTRFQLYLALKLASLEQYLTTAPPLPLVLDDVLVEWDDERASVALAVLAEFSEKTQILLFTHLARDVVAAERLGDGRIFTHHLADRGRMSIGLSPPP